MAKKHLIWILVIIVLVVGVFAYFEYEKISAVRDLDINIVGVAIEKVTYTSIQVGLIITITNPNLISVNIGEFRATAYANDVKISEIELPGGKLKPLETSEARFSLQVNFIDVGAALLKAIQERNVNWKIKGEYVLQLPFGLEYPYTFEKGST